jgi:hypothetical protein
MNFRYARHTNTLDPLVAFYTQVIGLEVLGTFTNHQAYDGVFLGLQNTDWHIEFTCSTEKVKYAPDPDDLLVFYVNTQEEINIIQKDAIAFGSEVAVSKNPYWHKNGIEINDPDGFGVVISIKQIPLTAKDDMTKLALSNNIQTWDSLVQHIKHLPYGRNANRKKLDLVLNEGKGTCSSKHALLKLLADQNNICGVKLILGSYKMTEKNTPCIGNILSENGFSYLPEAHCYLKINGKRLDVTHKNSSFSSIKNDIIEEIEIDPSQVDSFKVNYHKNFLENWSAENHPHISFDKIWSIRECCIEVLTKTLT